MITNKNLLSFRTVLSILAVSLLITSALVGCGEKPSTEEKVTEEEAEIIVEDSSGKVAEIDSSQPVEEEASLTIEGDTAEPPSPSKLPVIPLITDSTPLTMLTITEGEAQIMRSGTDLWIKAAVGMSVSTNDVIKAGEDSPLLITFFDGSTIELEPGAQIQVVEADSSDDGSTTIKIKQEIGNTISRVKKLTDPASRYEVETPAGTAAVRGSVMVVEVVEDGTTIITNLQGSIWAIAQGVELEVPEGMQCIIIPGQPPRLLYLQYGWPGGGGGGGGEPSPNPQIAVIVTTEPSQVHVEDTITYTYDVSNPGNVPLSDITVTNDIAGTAVYQGGDIDSDSELDTGEIWLYIAEYTANAEDSSPLINTVTVSGTYNSSQTVTAQGGIGVYILRPVITINMANEPAQVHDGDSITCTYTITNPGNTPLHNISVTDDVIGGITYQSGDTDGDDELDTGETWLYDANYTVTIEYGSPIIHTTTASGTDALARTVSAQYSASVDIFRPAISVLIETEVTEVYIGDNIVFGYFVTNPGNVPLHNVSVTDNVTGGTTYQSGDTDGDSELDTGETWFYIANYTVTIEDSSPLFNTADASGTDALTRTVSAQDSISIDILEAIATINIQIDTSMGAFVYIWDNTEDDWAIDEDTQIPVNGDNHTTPAHIAVAAGHHYTVWVYNGETYFMVKNCPKDWIIEEDGDKASGYAAANSVYSIHFTVSE